MTPTPAPPRERGGSLLPAAAEEKIDGLPWRRLRLAVGLLVSAGFAAWSLRGRDLHQIWAQLRAADYWTLVPYFALLLAIHLLRAWRWGLLLRPAAVSFRRLNAVSAVGFMAILVLPLRLGEFVRPYLIRERGRLSSASAVASIVAERVVDGLWVTGWLSVLLASVPRGSPHLEWIRRGGGALFALFIAILAILMLAVSNRERVERAVHAVAGRAAPRAAASIHAKLGAFLGGLRALPSAAGLAGILALTAVYWALTGVAFWVLARGFGLPLTLPQAWTCLGIRVIGLMIPAGPGMLGTFQAFTELGLTLFIPASAGAATAAYANVAWAGLFVQQVALGLLCLGSRDLSADHHRVTLGELAHAGEHLEPEPK